MDQTKKSDIIVTICGLGGSGKSTAIKGIAGQLGLDRFSSGDMFRKVASARGIRVEELDQLSEHDNGSADRDLDDQIAKMGRERDGFIIDSRFAWHFIPHSIKVLFKCSSEVRYKRIAERQGISLEQATLETKTRDESIFKRAYQYYGIEHFLNDTNFDIVIDTSTASPETIVQLSVSFILHHDKYRRERKKSALSIPVPKIVAETSLVASH